MEAARQRAEEMNAIKEGGTQVDIQDGTSEDFFTWMAENQGYTVHRNKDGRVEGISMDQNTIDGLINLRQEIIDNPDKFSKEDIKKAKKELKDLKSKGANVWMQNEFLGLLGSKNNYGAHVPIFQKDANGKPQLSKQRIFINKGTAHDAGRFHTASHELLHGILYQTLKRDPELQSAFGKVVLKALERKGVKIPKKVMDNIKLYSKQEGKGEEIMALISEAVRDEDIKLPGAAIRNFRSFFRGWSNKTTHTDIAFDTDQDVINFIQDYHYSMKNNKENKAITKMWSEGASGKLIADAKAEYAKRVKKNKLTKGEANFSKNVDQELSNNPDLLTEIDSFVKNEDGSPKYTDKDTWQTSTDFANAYEYITQKKKLDGLIQAGMVAEGVNTPEALREFTRKVKEELGMRLINNFDPTKNDSLFGWLTGVSGGLGKSIIYRAKGDVMVEYSKEIKAVSIDKGVTTAEGDTFSSQIEGEVDTEMERLETEVITIGKETVKKSDTDVVFLESVNAKVAKTKIDLLVEKAGVNLEGLTYNGTKKNIVQHDGGKPKSKRKPIGPLYGALQSISDLFGVDPMRIIKEQDLTGTQRSLAREYIKENAQQLINMLPEGENRSGDATGVANTVLGEFYIKGDRISMAESATGKGKHRQTKRDNITPEEFVEFFNKPGTKSDGAIRALITQAATISANQAIRLNAINKQSDPISTIALVGDGKSAVMFSKKKQQTLPTVSKTSLGKIGSIDRNLRKEGLDVVDDFWTNINAFANENILDRSLDSIKIALENTYAPFPEILKHVDQIAESIHSVVQDMKDPIIQDPIKLNEALITSNENQLTKVQQSSGSNINAAEAFRDEDRVKNYVATTTMLANKMFDPNDPGRSIAKIMLMTGHLSSMGARSFLKRKQILPGTKQFLENTLGKIPGIKYTVKTAKDGKVSLDTVTYNGNTVEVPSVSSSQLSNTAFNEIKAFENENTEKFEQRDINEDLAQETLNDIVAFYSDLFKREEIDNVDIMMVKASLLSGMGSVLGRAGKLTHITDEARALIEKHGKKAEVRFEHMPPRVSIVISMFDQHINGNGISNIKEYLKEFKVQIITQKFDKTINDAKLGSSLLPGTTINTPDVGMMRNYNNRTEGKYVEAVREIRTGKLVVAAEAFVKTNEMLLKNRNANIAFSKAVNQANTINENTPSRGMSAFDFDETVGISDNYVIAKKDGKTKKISSEDWPFF